MLDLHKLNRKIALHWLGPLDSRQTDYLCHVPVCIGQFTHGPAEFEAVLTRQTAPHHNSLAVAKLNRQYLRYARLAAKDVAAGKLDRLVRLGINLVQADALSNLSNEAINRLAFGWEGLIMQFTAQAFTQGVALRSRAAEQHARAFVAIRLAA
jgi:hypothetical protein